VLTLKQKCLPQLVPLVAWIPATMYRHETTSNEITNLQISQTLLISPYYGSVSYKILTSAIKIFSPTRILVSFNPKDV